jgi:hypothetical protein
LWPPAGQSVNQVLRVSQLIVVKVHEKWERTAAEDLPLEWHQVVERSDITGCESTRISTSAADVVELFRTAGVKPV